MSIFGDIWNGIKSVGHTVGGIAEHLAPVLGMIPGVGTLAATAIGGIGAGLHGDNILQGAAGGAAGGLAGGLLHKLTGGGGGGGGSAASADVGGWGGTDANGNPLGGGDGGGGGGGGSSGGLLGKIGVTGSELLGGVASGLQSAQNQDNINFEHGIQTGQLALGQKSEADTNTNTQTGLKTGAANGLGSLGVSSTNADTSRGTAAGNLALGENTGETTRAADLGQLGLGATAADTARSTAAASGGTNLLGALTNKQAVEGNQALTNTSQQMGQREFDTNTGVAQANTQYGRAQQQALAAARAKYVTGLAQGKTFAQQASAPPTPLGAAPGGLAA